MTMQRMEPQCKGVIRLKTSEGAAYEQQCLGGLRPPRHCCSYAAPSSVLSRISPCFSAPFAHCSNKGAERFVGRALCVMVESEIFAHCTAKGGKKEEEEGGKVSADSFRVL